MPRRWHGKKLRIPTHRLSRGAEKNPATVRRPTYGIIARGVIGNAFWNAALGGNGENLRATVIFSSKRDGFAIRREDGRALDTHARRNPVSAPPPHAARSTGLRHSRMPRALRSEPDVQECACVPMVSQPHRRRRARAKHRAARWTTDKRNTWIFPSNRNQLRRQLEWYAASCN